MEIEGNADGGSACATRAVPASGRGNSDHRGALNGMALPNQPHDPYPGASADPAPVPQETYDYDTYDQQPPKRRVRLAVWDVICTVAIWTVFFVVVTTTNWPSQLFGFVADVCPADSCAPVPFGIDLWIYPVVWGGIGAAVAAAVIGPCVSLLKGWYMFFWPILAMAVVVLSAVAGSLLTAFSGHYWH
jgi:hypothetical protein